jgi:hypothetical protein
MGDRGRSGHDRHEHQQGPDETGRTTIGGGLDDSSCRDDHDEREHRRTSGHADGGARHGHCAARTHEAARRVHPTREPAARDYATQGERSHRRVERDAVAHVTAEHRERTAEREREGGQCGDLDHDRCREQAAMCLAERVDALAELGQRVPQGHGRHHHPNDPQRAHQPATRRRRHVGGDHRRREVPIS